MNTETNKFGMTSWDDPLPVGAGSTGGPRKDSWMKLKNGSNLIRCVTDPFRYISHSYKEEGDSGHGAKINCSKELHGYCPICSKPGKENAPKQRWYLGVIDRDSDTTKILDIGPLVYKQILTLTRDSDYGNPVKYDIDIKVNRSAGPTGYYNVVPKPPRPLTESDMDKQRAFDLEMLKKLCTPPEPAKVQERIDAYRAKLGHKVDRAKVEEVDTSGGAEFTFQDAE